ncbi:hypothetical protein JKP88DRAFT_281222 [Tribonema minus]|uniref:Disease resistance R13L4/SHOC-2-like LRR domain-containing protein n=1 Tax=Tribonema minus TaxID=303371 RepID=A0A835YMS6_9STRA|nr:hypothetical protein JKP88DRAFT_281222 [Tribonema minus]
MGAAQSCRVAGTVAGGTVAGGTEAGGAVAGAGAGSQGQWQKGQRQEGQRQEGQEGHRQEGQQQQNALTDEEMRELIELHDQRSSFTHEPLVLKPDCVEELTTLSFSWLTDLNMYGCHMLESLPESFGNLTALTHLDMRCCRWELRRLPESFGNLAALTELNLESCNPLTSLPESFGNLTALVTLNLAICEKLVSTSALEQFKSLTTLELSFCPVHAGISDILPRLPRLVDLNFVAESGDTTRRTMGPCCTPDESALRDLRTFTDLMNAPKRAMQGRTVVVNMTQHPVHLVTVLTRRIIPKETDENDTVTAGGENKEDEPKAAEREPDVVQRVDENNPAGGEIVAAEPKAAEREPDVVQRVDENNPAGGEIVAAEPKAAERDPDVLQRTDDNGTAGGEIKTDDPTAAVEGSVARKKHRRFKRVIEVIECTLEPGTFKDIDCWPFTWYTEERSTTDGESETVNYHWYGKMSTYNGKARIITCNSCVQHTFSQADADANGGPVETAMKLARGGKLNLKLDSSPSCAAAAVPELEMPRK